VTTTGIGPLAAERAARGLLFASAPERVIVLGLCGLLAPAFRVGDSLVYREIVTPDERFAFDRELSGLVADRAPGSQSGIRAFASESIVTQAVDKRMLAERYAAQAVDMETAALARILQPAGVALAALRVGSDGASDDLPALDRALDGSGGMDGLALALAMLRRPLAGARLARNGTRALAALERTVRALFGA
jgi:nucleoside phosphorylase